MRIGGFQKLSTVDYPGHICSTIFLMGCNLRCKFCHNPRLVNIPEDAKDTTIEEIISFLKKRKGILEGVCISGGEPTVHKELQSLIQQIRQLGYKIKLDTNGTNPEVVKSLIDSGMINYIAVDIKATMEKYEDVTGCCVNTENIKKTIEIVMNSNVDYEFRTTFLPDLNENDINKIAGFLAGSKKYVVQQFRNDSTLSREYSNSKPYDPQYIMNIVDNIKPMFSSCEVRGIQ